MKRGDGLIAGFSRDTSYHCCLENMLGEFTYYFELGDWMVDNRTFSRPSIFERCGTRKGETYHSYVPICLVCHCIYLRVIMCGIM